MLAQSFKTATELKINDKAYEGLTRVLAILEMEEISYTSRNTARFGLYDQEDVKASPNHRAFNMYSWNYHVFDRTEDDGFVECGTVHCIGGLACTLMGAGDIEMYGTLRGNERNSQLSELFHPGTISNLKIDWNDIRPKHAAKALRRFLETGITDWAAALA